MNILKQISASKRGLKLNSLSKHCKVSSSFSSLDSSLENDSVVEVFTPEQEVVIALGSNIGDRLGNFNEALKMMKRLGVRVSRHGCLYETAPAYVTDQPRFLNSAIRAHTKLGPHELLKVLKKIEKDMGRTNGIRYGPRPIDLDVLFYGKFRVSSEVLTIPHERIWERPFVIAPVIDLLGLAVDNDTVACWHSFAANSSDGIFGSWERLGGDSLIGKEGMKRVLPINKGFWDWSEKTSVMGVLNLTPDSFSDGGKFQALDKAISRVRSMISEGADIIDIGAQSTRPMATKISPEEEMERLIPVLEAVLKMPEIEEKLVSIDTFHSGVALEAVQKGAHIVNDISAGRLDPEMLSTVAGLEVPYAAMHMRGDPSTMQSDENLRYNNVCMEIASELCARLEEAELKGVPAWRLIIDPGIGFSKNTEQNLDVLSGLPEIRAEIAKRSVALSRAPLLIGPSRKRFLGEICSRSDAVERDPATIAAVAAGILGGANIVRVHNVKDNVDSVKLCDAMLRRKKSSLPLFK